MSVSDSIPEHGARALLGSSGCETHQRFDPCPWLLVDGNQDWSEIQCIQSMESFLEARRDPCKSSPKAYGSEA